LAEEWQYRSAYLLRVCIECRAAGGRGKKPLLLTAHISRPLNLPISLLDLFRASIRVSADGIWASKRRHNCRVIIGNWPIKTRSIELRDNPVASAGTERTTQFGGPMRIGSKKKKKPGFAT